MKLTKIYTKTGDGGETSLVGGIRIAKSEPRIEAYGTIDELSSQLGLLVAMMKKQETHKEEYEPITETLQRIQNNLFGVASILATDAEALRTNPAAWVAPYLESLEKFGSQLETTETPLLEQLTDQYNEELPTLSSFLLPGGSTEAAQCHVCRAVCRRAERRIANADLVRNDALRKRNGASAYDNANGNVNPNANVNQVMQYVNRLSDYLFVLARKINNINKEEEKTWQNTCK